MVVPECNNYRQKITYWTEPIVKFPGALDVSEPAWLDGRVMGLAFPLGLLIWVTGSHVQSQLGWLWWYQMAVAISTCLL